MAYDVLCRVHEHHKFGSNSHIPEGEPPSPGQYYKPKSSPAQALSSSLSPSSPPSLSPDQPVNTSPLTSPSPTITVSFESALANPLGDVFPPSPDTPSLKYSVSPLTPHKLPSPQSPVSPQTPVRKISAPLPVAASVNKSPRKCSAPCSIPGSGSLGWSSVLAGGCIAMTSFSPPGVSSTYPSTLCESHPLHQCCHPPLHHGDCHAHDTLTPGPLCEKRGKSHLLFGSPVKHPSDQHAIQLALIS